MKKTTTIICVFISVNCFSQFIKVDKKQAEELKKELRQIEIEDQTLRFLLPDVTKRFGNNSDETSYFWTLIKRQDSICEQKVVIILKKYGWLGKSVIGAKANQALWLVIQHAKLKNQEKYLPFLKQSAAKGESEQWHFAFLKDRILMYTHKKQIYGTQALWDKDLKKMKIYPIKDLKNVNKRRKEIGLGTVEEHAKTNGYIFDQ